MSEDNTHIAIVGMAARLPGADTVEEYWSNLCAGLETISHFSDAEIRDSGVDEYLLNNPAYVRAGGVLENIGYFDAELFGLSPREAALADPQHRLLLECGWSALEDAGYDPRRYDGLVGVFVGARPSSYLINNLVPSKYWHEADDQDEAQFGNFCGFSATRLSFKLHLQGPSLFVQTACSTSLVAVHLACQELLNYECDMALAGGVSVQVPQRKGYLYQPEGILSPTGSCRPFDAAAAGTVFSNGVGLVVLKRLADARKDGDHIEAVILGSAINNDGDRKLSFTAPSVKGQAEVISMAQAVSGIESEQVGFVEAHGTGTQLGDPIEVAALSRVFGTERKGRCALGSVKANIGHLDAAAGIAALIKAAKVVKEGVIPPCINYESPNPELHLESSPFFINTEQVTWANEAGKRIAGVSSFGMGGTNAHLVLKEPPQHDPSPNTAGLAVMLLSAGSSDALDVACTNLADFARHARVPLLDMAFTLQQGRVGLAHRCGFVSKSLDDIPRILADRRSAPVIRGTASATAPRTAFMFPGQGSQYVGMGRELYRSLPAFREQFVRCAEILKPLLHCDIALLIDPADADIEQLSDDLTQTRITQPVLFAFEYALARTWETFGVQPDCMIGHSLGEYVAACLAGVMSLEDALQLVVSRGELVQSLAAGAMLAVSLAPDELLAKLNEHVELAAVNAPESCVVSGVPAAIADLEARLSSAGVGCRRLHTSHAFHSFMLDPVLAPFREKLSEIRLAAPAIPFVSNVTGTWITQEEAVDPEYWVRHLRETVRFSAGIDCLLEQDTTVLLEVGPGNSLCTFSRQHRVAAALAVVQSNPHPREESDSLEFLYRALVSVWTVGLKVDWMALPGSAERRRVSLPTYPFQRKRYWVDPEPWVRTASRVTKIADPGRWFYEPTWRRVSLLPSRGTTDSRKTTRLLLLTPGAAAETLVNALSGENSRVIVGYTADKFAECAGGFHFDPLAGGDYGRLLEAMDPGSDRLEIIHAVQLSREPVGCSRSEREALCLSLINLARVLASSPCKGEVVVNVATRGSTAALGGEKLLADAALLQGITKVLGQEYPAWYVRHLDFAVTDTEGGDAWWLRALIRDLDADIRARELCYRSGNRWQPEFIEVDTGIRQQTLVRPQGNYLITGGLGRVGLAFANYLAGYEDVGLVLLTRSAIPPRSEWMKRDSGSSSPDWLSRLAEVEALEKLGARVHLVTADVSDHEAMQRLFSELEQEVGAISGVIHAAGLVTSDMFKPLAEIKAEDLADQFGPKVDGAEVLARVLEGRSVDFCMLISSLSAQLGGLGSAVYSAANHYLNSVAARQRQQGKPWVSVNWDTWKFEESFQDTGAVKTALDTYYMTRAEGIGIMGRVFAVAPSLAEVCVSVGDLSRRYEQWVAGSDEVAQSDNDAGASSPVLESPADRRRDLIPPDTETQRVLAGLWQELLGVGEISTNDNFFELGGDSLKALRLTSRIRQHTGIDLSTNDLFKRPTILELAGLLDDRKAASVSADGNKAALLKAQIERMTPEEVRALLAKKRRDN